MNDDDYSSISNPSSTVKPSSRRTYLLSLAGIVASGALAGCSSDDTRPPEQVTDENQDSGETAEDTSGSEETPQGGSNTDEESTPRTTQAALGDVIEGPRLALVAYDAERTTELGRFTRADAGNEFVVIEMAAKNKSSDEFISFSSFLQVTLRDSESYEYNRAITGIDNSLQSGELAPGEVTRGAIVFEVPEDTAGLTLNVDLSESVFQYSRATIDLETQGSGRTLSQDLRVPIYAVGDTLEYETTRFTVNGVRTSMGGDFSSPDAGNEFLIADITVENRGDEELQVSTLLQMEVKDSEGRTDSTSITAMSTLDRGFSQGQPIAPGSDRRGEVAFEVERGLSPLYLVMNFDIFAEGDKSFFQLR